VVFRQENLRALHVVIGVHMQAAGRLALFARAFLAGSFAEALGETRRGAQA